MSVTGSALSVSSAPTYGERRADSDLDVRVAFTELPGLLTYLELQHSLSDLLGVKVDLLMKRSRKPRIGQRIRTEAVPE